MQSKITIEVDFNDSNLPYIRIIQKRSDDVRDKILNNFLQSLAHQSSWCKIFYDGNALPDEHYWTIKAITPNQFVEESKLMDLQSRVIGEIPPTSELINQP